MESSCKRQLCAINPTAPPPLPLKNDIVKCFCHKMIMLNTFIQIDDVFIFVSQPNYDCKNNNDLRFAIKRVNTHNA